ncbi:hypothetical protein CUJ87_00130 [Paraburkholderia caledonica]|nr:hypothetical protein CUJ87_00130 [Paraburkholderia caledonica]
MTGVTLGFIPEPLSVPVVCILPSRRTPAAIIDSRKFKQIKASIEEIGLIEPLSVTAAHRSTGQHVLLDGHLRLIAMQELEFVETSCLVAIDDES